MKRQYEEMNAKLLEVERALQASEKSLHTPEAAPVAAALTGTPLKGLLINVFFFYKKLIKFQLVNISPYFYHDDMRCVLLPPFFFGKKILQRKSKNLPKPL